jgi:hypothetical protein
VQLARRAATKLETCPWLPANSYPATWRFLASCSSQLLLTAVTLRPRPPFRPRSPQLAGADGAHTVPPDSQRPSSRAGNATSRFGFHLSLTERRPVLSNGPRIESRSRPMLSSSFPFLSGTASVVNPRPAGLRASASPCVALRVSGSPTKIPGRRLSQPRRRILAVPPEKAALALGSGLPRFRVPQENGAEKEKRTCTYQLCGI